MLMLTRLNTSLLITLALLIPAKAIGQTAASQSQSTTAPQVRTADEGAQADTMELVGSLFGIAGPPLAGRPYSAQLVWESTPNLPSGTPTKQPAQRTLVYRDSQGRTRVQQLTSSTNLIEITDPVDGYEYSLDPSSHTAQRKPLTTGSIDDLILRVPANLAGRGASRPHVTPETSTESLGIQFIEDVAAEGTRTTTVYPKGWMGSTAGYTSVHESWWSSELQIVVLSKLTNPQVADTTMTLENLSLAEPDPSLFQVPKDYRMVDPPAIAPGCAPLCP